jgi:stress-induced-phosphoprotein 1
MLQKLAANPKFASYLADEAFVAKLKKITNASSQAERSAALTEALGAGMPGAVGAGAEGGGDPRLFEVLMYLMGVGGPGGAGGFPGEEDEDDEGGIPTGGMSYEKMAEMRAKQEEEAERRAKEAKAAAEKKAKEEAERKAAEEEANMTEDEKAKKQKKKDAQKKKDEGNSLYKSKQFDAAIACYDEAYSMDNEDILFLVNKAAALMEKGELDECIAVCKKALERGSEVMAPYASKAKAWARIGNAELKRNNLSQAIEAYESSLLESHSDDVSLE